MPGECPGSKILKQPRPEIFTCPDCGYEVEIWTDEIRRKCPACGRMVTRFQDMSCVEWCKMAKNCVGEDAYNRYMINRATSFIDL